MVIISGETMAGKTTIAKRLEEMNLVSKVVTCTTRPARPAEINGIHYHFITPKQMTEEIAEGKFVEFAVVYGNIYGTRFEDLKACKNTPIVVLNPEGLDTFAETLGKENITSIFIKRGFEIPDEARADMSIRVAEDAEMDLSKYDLIILNVNLDETVETIARFIKEREARQ